MVRGRPRALSGQTSSVAAAPGGPLRSERRRARPPCELRAWLCSRRPFRGQPQDRAPRPDPRAHCAFKRWPEACANVMQPNQPRRVGSHPMPTPRGYPPGTRVHGPAVPTGLGVLGLAPFLRHPGTPVTVAVVTQSREGAR